MNSVEVLHNAARDYCLKRAAQWANGHVGGWVPRHGVLVAILHEVEGFVHGDFDSLAECREFLMAAGETAKDAYEASCDETEAAAINDERTRYIEFVKSARV